MIYLMNPYFQLAQYILPSELFTHFELCRVEEVGSELHLYLEEKNLPPDSDIDLHPNGFHDESCIRDFPIRNHKVSLHVRRRRWKSAEGKSVSKDWKLVAEGTRHSPEFAAFLKGLLGEIPDYGPLS